MVFLHFRTLLTCLLLASPSLRTAFCLPQLSTNSILAMRGKSTTRTSLFKGFLDPKNGFKAPKLKAGALRR